jgi:2'-5' RNA ligase
MKKDNVRLDIIRGKLHPFDPTISIDEIATAVTERIIKFMPDVSSVEVKKDARIGGLPNGRSKTYDQGKLDALNIKKMNERTGGIEYGVLMVNCKIDNWKDKLGKIDKDDVYERKGFGKETEPHVTILYGFHDNVKPSEVLASIKDKAKNPIEMELTKISYFETPEYDVVKYDVKSDLLYELNKIAKSFPHTTNFPNYNPHMTISYVKKGRGKKYVEDLKQPIKIKSKEIVYSTVDKQNSYLKS